MSQALRYVLTIGTVIVLLLLALVGLVLTLLLTGRFGPIPEERVEAVRLMSEPVAPVRGRDGSDALWTSYHDVPPADRARVAAAHRVYRATYEDLRLGGRADEAARLVDPLARYSTWPQTGQEHLCDTNRSGCLRHVREHRASVDAVLRERAGELERARAFVGFDGVRFDPLPRDADAWPSLSPGRNLALTALAAQFVRGEHEQAIAATCRDLAGWRRIGADNDLAGQGYVAAALVRGDLLLLADMLLERDAGAALPEECAAALAPPTDAELTLCPGVRAEFRQERDRIARPEPRERQAYRFIDPDQFMSVIAPRFARYCGAGMLAAVRADELAATVPEPQVECGPLESLAHFHGCYLAENPNDAWATTLDRYVDVRADQAASIALMRTWLWLRAQSPDPASWPALLRQRPESLGLRREVSLRPEGLAIPLHDTKRRKHFVLPTTADPPRGSR